MNHARGDMRADYCGLVECRGAGGGQGEKFDGRRPAVSPERQAKKNQSQNHSGGVATWSEEAVVRFFSGEGWAVESLTLSLEQRNCNAQTGELGNWWRKDLSATGRQEREIRDSDLDSDCLRTQNPCRMSLRFESACA
ncbi:uncharacterized protein APUU_80863S [Aspergillus puulaauensis]|uniref:Uncharacterized protein n=1 Tax=Aspergillus puulaauensis TaxID=1220207 RepID=A0A7R7XZG6_9EURO|nr:uncharacterized protein APUU_80863S [Aspergillus puulaauensis]BCS30560.1 hypothetical protein APUU_80863S [Aspergillus puulaauensis]